MVTKILSNEKFRPTKILSDIVLSDKVFCRIFPGSKILTLVFVRERDFLETTCISNTYSNCELLSNKKHGNMKLLKSRSCVISISFYSCRGKHSLEINMLEMNLVGLKLKKETIRQWG